MAVPTQEQIIKITHWALITKDVLSDPTLFTGLVMPSPLKMYDHQAYAYNKMQSFNGREERENREHTDRIFMNHRRYFDPNNLINCHEACYDPRFVEDFLWGPYGEWTGYPKPRGFDIRLAHIPYGRIRGGPSWGGNTDHRTDFSFVVDLLMPDGEMLPFSDLRDSYYQRIARGGGFSTSGLHPVARFINYGDLADYGESSFNNGGLRSESKQRMSDALELAGLIQNTRANSANFRDWRETLQSGKYAFGYGVMRDGEDKFDALGVLAEMNNVDWEWDEDEQAWKIVGGNVFAPNEDQVRNWLMIPDKVPVVNIRTLIQHMPRISDNQCNFKTLATALNDATEVINHRRAQLQRIIEKLPPDHRMESVAGHRADFGVIDDPRATFDLKRLRGLDAATTVNWDF